MEIAVANEPVEVEESPAEIAAIAAAAAIETHEKIEELAEEKAAEEVAEIRGEDAQWETIRKLEQTVNGLESRLMEQIENLRAELSILQSPAEVGLPVLEIEPEEVIIEEETEEIIPERKRKTFLF